MSTIFPTTVPSKRLSESITGASSSFKVNSITGWDGNALTSADFGTKLYAVFRNSAGTLMEIMQIDPTTITAASSAITITLRGLKFTGDLTTEVSANKLTWVKGDTIVEIGTHVPQLLKSFVDIYAAQTIEGVKTFSSLPVIPATPSSSTDAASKGYVDSVVGGVANYDQNIISGTLSASVTAGQVLYQIKNGGATAGKWTPASAANKTSGFGRPLGIAQASGSSSDIINILIGGLDKKQTGLTAGAPYYLSDTSGAIATTPGTVEMFLGFANLTTTELVFAPTAAVSPNILTLDGVRDYILATGTGDVITLTYVPALLAYSTGMRVRFKASAVNTTAVTVNINGLGAKDLKKTNGSTALVAGDIASGQIVDMVYDGTAFQMVSPVGKTKLSQDSSEVYAADSVGTDAYAVTLSPAIAAYSNGLTVRFKAGTANTAACTLAVNGLSAITIKKNVSSDLETGDILLNQIVEVVYDGTNFQLISRSSVPIFKCGTATYDISTASGVQNIAHGAGKIPNYVRITSMFDTDTAGAGGNSVYVIGHTVYNGTTQASVSNDGSGADAFAVGSTFQIPHTSGAYQTGVVTVDATNIIITWTKTGSPTGTARLMWEAFA